MFPARARIAQPQINARRTANQRFLPWLDEKHLALIRTADDEQVDELFVSAFVGDGHETSRLQTPRLKTPRLMTFPASSALTFGWSIAGAGARYRRGGSGDGACRQCSLHILRWVRILPLESACARRTR